MTSRLVGLVGSHASSLAALPLLGRPALAGPSPPPSRRYSIFHVFPGESIQYAIDDSAPGDTVLVHAGIYTEHITMTSRISLYGMGWDQTIITGATGLQYLRHSISARASPPPR